MSIIGQCLDSVSSVLPMVGVNTRFVTSTVGVNRRFVAIVKLTPTIGVNSLGLNYDITSYSMHYSLRSRMHGSVLTKQKSFLYEEDSSCSTSAACVAGCV